jgi:hypothetical protein
MEDGLNLWGILLLGVENGAANSRAPDAEPSFYMI